MISTRAGQIVIFLAECSLETKLHRSSAIRPLVHAGFPAANLQIGSERSSLYQAVQSKVYSV